MLLAKVAAASRIFSRARKRASSPAIRLRSDLDFCLLIDTLVIGVPGSAMFALANQLDKMTVANTQCYSLANMIRAVITNA
jgi:hypothetical protein